jgi:hypothetical protein
MTLVAIAPFIAAVLLIAWMAFAAAAPPVPARWRWILPAAVSVLFLIWSVAAIIIEGPLGFWPVHASSLWGNQVWFDLLIAVGIGWALVQPRLRAAGITPWPWLVVILASGCIGFTALMARLAWREARLDGSPGRA